VESRMRWKSHVRFGGRARETHQPKGWQGALVRPLHIELAPENPNRPKPWTGEQCSTFLEHVAEERLANL
jgi:hypothetical protein